MPGKKAPEGERRDQILQAALRVALRDRLDGLTIRAVAQEAGLSPGLIFFHFGSKDDLLYVLLDWLLATTIVAEVGPEILAEPAPVDRLLALLRQELGLLYVKRERLELFFDYWVLGSRNQAIRLRIREALDGYRSSFGPLAAAVIAADPQRLASVSPEGLAALIASLIQGCAIQVIKDPEHLDLTPLLAGVCTLLGRDIGELRV